jgi:hypothetical protein
VEAQANFNSRFDLIAAFEAYRQRKKEAKKSPRVREKVPEETVNDELEELIKRTHQAIVVEGRNGKGLAVSSGGSRSRNEK